MASAVPSEVTMSGLWVILVLIVIISSGFMPRPIPGKQDPRFPKVWHGNFVVLLGLVIAFLGDFGFLGGMQHREEDLDTASRFVFCGLGLVVLGFILQMWNWIRNRRNYEHSWIVGRTKLF